MRRAGAAGWFLHDVKNRGITAWVIFALLFVFYVVIYFGQYYWTPESCTTDDTCWSEGMVCTEDGACVRDNGFERGQQWIYDNATIHFDRAGWAMFSGQDEATDEEGNLVRDDNDNGTIDNWEHFGSRWSVYGLLYTLAIVLGGIWMFIKYRHNPYQVVRTSVVMFVQVSFGFAIPILLKFFQQPEYYFSYLWPLKIEYLDPRNFEYYGEALVLYGFFGSLVMTPLLAVFFGKRWYCSWVCGCGGLANTFGEPWRHLSDKSSTSWKIEKVTIHSVLVIALVSTAIWIMSAAMPESEGISNTAAAFRKYYGLFVIATLSGVVGVAFYPIGGTRIWCRFACPMAAALGLMQKFGRYRIRVKRDMCISCGMCSKYCEMGIDVRAYAQANQSFTRASCVGCGLCAEVCPRGVLRLENVRRRDPQELSVESMINESWKGDDSRIDARN